MTDYLKLLLEEQREEQRREPWAWRWRELTSQVPPAESSQSAEETRRDGPEGESGGWTVEYGGDGGPRPVQSGGRPEPEAGTRSWLAGTAELRQAEAQVPEEDGPFPRAGDTGALWADRAVKYSLALRTEAASPRSGEWSLQGPGAAPELEAERLDRLFRRDARRFDGGFQLL